MKYLFTYVLQIYCTAPCVAAQCLKSEDSFGDMYQGWTQVGETMIILTPDTDLSTDLVFVTPDVDPLRVFGKLSVVSLTESMSGIYLNGDKIEVNGS